MHLVAIIKYLLMTSTRPVVCMTRSMYPVMDMVNGCGYDDYLKDTVHDARGHCQTVNSKHIEASF